MPITVKGESHIYIHEMDYGRRQRLQEILDAGDTWKELSQKLVPPYPREKVEKFARSMYVPGGSPTDALLADWGRGNRTVVELFKILAHMKHYQAMECLKEDIPTRYHKYIPRSYLHGNGPDTLNCPNISTVNLPVPENNTRASHRSHQVQPMDSSSTAGLPSYRSRSNVHLPNRENKQSASGRVVPPKRYNQVRDRIVMNNLDSNQRNKEPSQDEKYPQKNIQHHDTPNYVNLPSDQTSQGGLAQQLNKQHQAMHDQSPMDRASNIPQILVSSQPKALCNQVHLGINNPQLVRPPLGMMNKSRHNSQPSGFLRSDSQGTNATVGESTFRKRILEEGKVQPTQDIMLKNVSLRELSHACNDFHISNQIGKGGFGVVYRGRWNGQDIAVKRIKDERRRPGDVKVFKRYVNQAINELISLHNFPAENILPLFAYSYNENYPDTFNDGIVNAADHFPVDLVYMYMVNGSVSDRLKRRGGTEPLSWEQRSNIALGTARGLVHLHSHKIIHGDIKSGNILLDKHFEPKIGDFGLARGGPESDSMSYILASSLQGTMSYLPDDYCRNRQLTEQVDTFCYGMFLFELVSGKSPSWQDPDCARSDLPNYCKCKNRSSMRELMLSATSLNYHSKLVDQMAGISENGTVSKSKTLATHPWAECLFRFGKDCTKNKRKARPMMEQIFSALERVHQNPQTLQCIPGLELGNDTELIVSSAILSSDARDMAVMPTINEGGPEVENEDQSPSARPLPESEAPLPIPGTSSNPFCSNMTNRAPPQYIAPMIPLPILDSYSNVDDTGTNKSFEVVSEDPTEGSYLGYNSDDIDDNSRSIAYTNEGSDAHARQNHINDGEIHANLNGANSDNGAAALRLRHLISMPEYELPNLIGLSILDDVKVENTEAAHPNAKDSACTKSSNHQDKFDDGIPTLPDLGWISDHGEVDPLERLSKAESAVIDSSKKDLMSDL